MKNILYARKSSEAEDRQAMSIDSQISELNKLAQAMDLRIDKIFTESKSAKQEGRPEFNKMLRYIDENKGCTLLAWKVDRLTRNIDDGAKLVKRLENGTINQIRTIDKIITNNPTDKFLLLIDFGVGKKYSDDLSVNVKRGFKSKREFGGWPGMAPFGYLNDKINKTVIPDPQRAKYVKRLFVLYKGGIKSLVDISKILYDEGLRSKAGNQVGKSTLHRTLNNPFYYGVMEMKGQRSNGTHQPLISKQLFDEVQDIINDKKPTKPRPSQHIFPYRGFLTCAKCGCALTADIKRNRYVYYYCTDGKKICARPRKFLPNKKVDTLVSTIFDQITFDENLVEIMAEAARQKQKSKKEYAEATHNTLLDQLKFNQEKQKRLLDTRVAGYITEEVYKEKLTELENARVDLENQMKKVSQNLDKGAATFEQTKKIFLKGNKAKKEFIKAKDDKKRHLLENLLSNISLEGENVAKISYKMPYQLLADAPKNGNFDELLGR